VEQDRKEAAAWLDHAEGRNDAAIAALRAIAEKQEASGDESDYEIPAREMLADMLLEMKHADEALAEYKTSLKSFPNRFDSLYGAAQAAEMAGFASQARSITRRWLRLATAEVRRGQNWRVRSRRWWRRSKVPSLTGLGFFPFGYPALTCRAFLCATPWLERR